MNEQTEQNINEAINWLQKTGGSIQDFAVEQAPLYCREVVRWNLWGGGLEVAAGMLLASLAIFAFRQLRKVHKEDDCSLAVPGWTMAFLACFIPALILFLGGVFDATKAIVAPRLVIVEHLRKLK